MKTIIAIIAIVCGCITAFGQPYTIDTTTPHGSYYGDDPITLSGKMNSNTVYFAALFGTMTNQVITLSNNVATLSNTLALHTLQIGTNNLAIAALTNRVNGIQTNGSSGGEIVIIQKSPDGTIWYHHVANTTGIDTVTSSP